MKIWILFLCVVVVGVTAQSDESVGDWDDGWKEYDDEWFRKKLDQLGIYNDEQQDSADSDAIVSVLERDQDEMDNKVKDDIEKFQETDGVVREFHEEDDVVKDVDKNDDYQFEDNRSEQSDEVGNDNKAKPIHDTNDGNDQDLSHLESENDYDDYALNVDDFEENVSDDDDGLQIPEPQFSKDDNIVPLPSPDSSEEIKRIIEEAQAIIKQEQKQPNDFANNDDIRQESSDEINDIVEETEAILDKSLKPNDFAEDETVHLNGNISEASEESNHGFATLNKGKYDDELPKIKQDEVENQVNIPKKEGATDDNSSDNIVNDDADTVDKVYEDLNEDLDQLFDTIDKLSNGDINADEKLKAADVDYAVNSDESLDDKLDYDNIFDSNLSDLFAQYSKDKTSEDLEDANAAIEAKDSKNKDDELIKHEDEIHQPEGLVLERVPYINDALLSDDKANENPIKSINVDVLSDEQLLQLMKDFETQHSDVFDVESLSDDHFVNGITLEYGETKIITSENYPSGYPTNRVVDWIVTGNGQGIEMNVTDFAVNSAAGDYLMVKPGQADDSGSEGLIFSYHLNEPRAFRFMDVNKIFIRFDAKQGMSWMRGFSLTLKVIAPPPQEPEPEPEPEPVLPEPKYTLTVMLGGLTLLEFQEIKEQFRLLVADMATMYINAIGILPGLNTTEEITQLISASLCNVQWPGYEQCTQVRFSVPLVYEDEDDHRLNETDLQTMWETYVVRDPFAARLRQMGIEEFSVPNDGGVLTVWLVVALGVVVSAAMLAFALWRYSCFEEYSRMPTFSDTDSLYEKHSSALYPTPHQMLPPLYGEKDYDSTRVDIGGYANRSYTRTDMYDLDSDEDAVPRDRNAGIQPRDIFSA